MKNLLCADLVIHIYYVYVYEALTDDNIKQVVKDYYESDNLRWDLSNVQDKENMFRQP